MASYVVHGEFACFFKSKLSQWHMCTIKDGDLTFNCAEQMMMYRKAELFGDHEMMKRILESDNPKEQKDLGRKVRGFDKDVWNSQCRDIVFRNNVLRFSQNEYLKEILLSAKGLTFVECSPYDTIWGIGRGMDYPHLDNPDMWRGLNWLGLALTFVRWRLFDNPIKFEDSNQIRIGE